LPKLGIEKRVALASAVTGVLALLACPAAVAQPANDGEAVWAAMRTSLLPMRAPVSQEAQWTVRSTFSAFSANDAVPALEATGDWQHYSPTSGRNSGLQQGHFELTASRSGWELAAIVRSDILVSASRGAVDAVHAYRQKLTLPEGSDVPVDTRQINLTMGGLRVARTWAFEPAPRQTLQFTGALTALSVQDVQLWNVGGRVGYTNADGYKLNSTFQRQDSRKQFYGYGSDHPTGYGYTADLGVMWTPTETSFINVSAVDLFSRVNVDGVATQRAKASSSTKTTDAEGYVEYQPLISGRYSSERVDLSLDPMLGISGGMRVDWLGRGTLVGARFEHIANINIPSIWAVLPLAAGFGLQLEAETRFHTFGIGLNHRYGSLMLRTSSLSINQSEALGVQAAVNIPF